MRTSLVQGRGHRGEHGAPTFFRSKKKKGDKGKKERFSKQKLLTGHQQGQNIIVLSIIERLEFENISWRPTMVPNNTFQCYMPPQPPSPTLKSISPTLSLEHLRTSASMSLIENDFIKTTQDSFKD